jgi:hypothetical protein
MYFVSVKYSGLEVPTKAPENDTFSTREKLYVPPPSVTTEAVSPLPLSKATGATGLELGLDDEQPQAPTSTTAVAHLTSFIGPPFDSSDTEIS